MAESIYIGNPTWCYLFGNIKRWDVDGPAVPVEQEKDRGESLHPRSSPTPPDVTSLVTCNFTREVIYVIRQKLLAMD